MNHLKQTLSLALCLALAVSTMVVGAGAVFTDQSSIQNTEAVDACVSLNIISGYPDASYQPAGNVTRAEMCKMICVALNGGQDPDLKTSTAPSFTDISGWAEKYIEHCYSLGIVAGAGDGTFDPKGQVTGTQAAKMLLCALGYDAAKENFTGNLWSLYVNTVGNAAGLFEGLSDVDPAQPLTRDNAAQMVWNALNAAEVEYVTETVTHEGQTVTTTVCKDKLDQDGKTPLTLIKDKYGVDAPPAAA